MDGILNRIPKPRNELSIISQACKYVKTEEVKETAIERHTDMEQHDTSRKL